MAGHLMKIVATCCGRALDTYNEAGSGRDGLLWCQDIGQHAAGEFSMAVVQANSLLEDASQIESGSYGTFVGVYDGHGGPEAALYVADNLFENIRRFIVEEEGMSVDVLRKAFLATEDGFLSIVKKKWSIMPLLATVGSCCLTGFICNGMLYVANLGDSRAVLGRFNMHEREFMAAQLTPEHNACHESVREELRLLHPEDPKIVVLKNRAWRVKGIIQVSRSIGDAYLKKAEFNREPLIGKYRVSESFSKPILMAEPSPHRFALSSSPLLSMAKEDLLPVTALQGPSVEIWPSAELRLSHAFWSLTAAFCFLLSPPSAVVSVHRRETNMPDWIVPCYYFFSLLLFLIGKLQLVLYAAAAGDPSALRRLSGPSVALMTATLVPALAAVVLQVAVAVTVAIQLF